MTNFTYIRRVRQREKIARLKQLMTFGFVLGLLITLFSMFKYLFVVNFSDKLWQIMSIVGIVIIFLSIVLPTSIAGVEKLFRLVTQKIGETVFSLILVMIYLMLIIPVGLFLQSSKGVEPFYSWENKCNLKVEGWIKKELKEDLKLVNKNSQKLPLLLQPITVISYFIRNGHYVFIPILILMLTLGLIMFFVQTSSLAPFIYTLF